MRVSDSRQLALFDQHVESAFTRIGGLLASEAGQVCRLARERMQGIGLAEYGDKSWHLTLDELVREILEEFADALVYSVIRQSKLEGDA